MKHLKFLFGMVMCAFLAYTFIIESFGDYPDIDDVQKVTGVIIKSESLPEYEEYADECTLRFNVKDSDVEISYYYWMPLYKKYYL